MRRVWVVTLFLAWLACPLWAQSGAEFQQLLAKQMELQSLRVQALALESAKKYREALEIYRRLVAQAEAMPRFPGAAANTWQSIYNATMTSYRASVLDSLGNCLVELGEFEEALAAYQKALALLDPQADYFRAATIHSHIGSTYHSMAQYEKSLRKYREAVEAARQATAYLLQQFEGLGQTQEEIKKNASKCMEYLETFNTLRGVYLNATSVLFAVGRYEEVIATHSSAEFQRLHQWFKDPKVRTRLTWAASEMMGEALGPSVVALQDELNRLTDVRIENDTGACYNALANETGSAQQYEKAVEFLQKATALARQLSPAQQAPLVSALDNLGYAYEGLKRTAQAEKMYREALAVARRLPTRDPVVESYPWLNLAFFYLTTNNPAGAQEALQNVEALKEALKNLNIVWHFHTAYGRLLELKGDLSGAMDRLRKAVDIVEQQRAGLHTVELKQTFFRERKSPYEHLIRVLHKIGRHNEAFFAMEKVRARAFADQIQNLDIYKGVSPETKAKEREAVRKQVALIVARNRAETRGAGPAPAAELAAQTEEVTSQQRRTFVEIIAEAPEYAALTGQADPLKPQEIAPLLDEQTVLLSYFLGEQTAMVAVLHGNGKSLTAPLKAEPKRIKDAVREFATVLRNPADPAWRKPSEELYAMVVGPVEKEIQGKRRLVVVPSDALNYLPFGALARPAGGSLLIESHQIVVLPSATVLKFCRAKSTGRYQSAVIFALGNVQSENFKALPGTLNEARAIKSLLPDAQLVAEREFTLDRVVKLSAQRDIIHFATHGYLDRDNPMQSAIITADKPLTVADVFNLNLKANLVVLSACETGRGKLFGGDELIGLTRAFIYAGTPSIMATLWPVADESTAEFAVSFYKHLRAAGTDKAAACQKAQLALMKKFPHPNFWAPFQLLGDWK